MDEALRVYSWQGILTEQVKATDVKSRADARKLGPFADYRKNRLTWVNWSRIQKTGRWRRAHFRHLPKQINLISARKEFSKEIEKVASAKSESSKHRKAKEYLATHLRQMVASGLPLKWAFKDTRVSDYPLTGNFLSGVTEVITEYPIHTPFGKDYKLDIALLGNKIVNQPIVLGAIEIEFTHEFEMSRCLMCKALGFPMICIDITEYAEDELSQKWIKSKLVETTQTSPDQRRRNYIYIHNMLYPVYIDLPSKLLKHRSHQYVIFINDDQFEKLLDHLRKLKEALNLSDNEVLIQPVSCKNEQMITMLKNEGSIAGHDWSCYNSWRYIRMTLARPVNKSGAIYKYHLAMTKLLNSDYETLVGYKYRTGIQNENKDDPFWRTVIKTEKGIDKVPVLPKYVSEPLGSILSALETLS